MTSPVACGGTFGIAPNLHVCKYDVGGGSAGHRVTLERTGLRNPNATRQCKGGPIQALVMVLDRQGAGAPRLTTPKEFILDLPH